MVMNIEIVNSHKWFNTKKSLLTLNAHRVQSFKFKNTET